MAEPARRKSRWKWILLLLCVAGGAAYFEWDRVGPLVRSAQSYVMPQHAAPSAAAGPSAVPVTATQAVTGDFPVVLTGLGNVQPYNTVLVRTRVDGQIMKVNFQEGQIVHEGDLLAEIDPRPFKAALDQAQAKKQQDQATIENAKRDLSRFQSLARSDFATRQQLDTQTALVAQLTAQLAADDAAIETAQTQLDYATIRAPLTGRTGFRLVDQGNIVNASSATGIVSIAQIEPIAVVFTAPEDTLPQITAGLKAGALEVKALSSDGSQLLSDGKLELFNNEIDTASGTIRLKAAFDNKDHKLWPGLSVSTKLTVSTRKGAVLIPVAAVQRSQAGLFAFVVGPDNKAEQRPIKVNLSDDRNAVVEDGIKAGEQVVVAGQYRLEAGTLVKVVSPQAQQQTSQRDS